MSRKFVKAMESKSISRNGLSQLRFQHYRKSSGRETKMGTLILKESKGAAAKTAEQQEALKQENDTTLRELILTASEEAKLEATSELIAAAKMRFTFRDGEVQALSIYKDIPDFVKRHNHGAPTVKTVMESVDERAMKKSQLYDELCHYAETGNMKAYRTTREEYARL